MFVVPFEIQQNFKGNQFIQYILAEVLYFSHQNNILTGKVEITAVLMVIIPCFLALSVGIADNTGNLQEFRAQFRQ